MDTSLITEETSEDDGYLDGIEMKGYKLNLPCLGSTDLQLLLRGISVHPGGQGVLTSVTRRRRKGGPNGVELWRSGDMLSH